MAENGRGIIGRLVLLIRGDNSQAKVAIKETEEATQRAAAKHDAAQRRMIDSLRETAKGWRQNVSEITSFIGSVVSLTAVAKLAFDAGQKLGKTWFGDAEKIAASEQRIHALRVELARLTEDAGRALDPIEKAVRDATAPLDRYIDSLYAQHDAATKAKESAATLAALQDLITNALERRGQAANRAREAFEKQVQAEIDASRKRQAELAQEQQRQERFAALRQLGDQLASLESREAQLDRELSIRRREFEDLGLQNAIPDLERYYRTLIERERAANAERERLRAESQAKELQRIREREQAERAAIERINNARFENRGVSGGDLATLRELKRIARNTKRGGR